jgi:cellulose synthase operon protein C
MHSPSRPPNAATSIPPDPSIVTAAIGRLRAEHDATQSSILKALLLHEIAVLEELIGDEAAAARDQLGAVNAEPEFREPLERLIAIIERRQSFKNLGKLLERLVRVADGSDERCRALLEQAAYLSDHEQDTDGARTCLEEAVAEKPDDVPAWLALELFAGKVGDDALRLRALAARARLCQHPTWRALLLLDLGRALQAAGEQDAALAAVDEAIELKSSATFIAALALEELAAREERHDLSARARELQAELVMRAVDDPAAGDELGVPNHRRNPACAADAWLRAAEAQRRRGDAAVAAELLDRAIARLPAETALIHARLSAAEATGDTATAARLAQAELEGAAKGSPAAALWLRVAEAAAAAGDGLAALEAVTRALAEDPGCIPARALQLDLLGGGHDPQALASALESAAEQLPTDEAKARFFVLAADVWARLCNDNRGARAALSQAGMLGAFPSLVARLARMLAALGSDPTWYDEATRRLLASGSNEREQVGLWFELVRARLARGDLDSTIKALEGLAAAPGGRWLAHAIGAYALPLGAQPGWGDGGIQALRGLAEIEADPAAGRALRIVCAARALASGQADEARRQLAELHASDPSDAVTSAALAALERQHAGERRAADVLVACAAAVEDSELSAALELEAGILCWQAGDRTAAVECMTRAAAAAPSSGGSVLGWALRAFDPDSEPARRRALEASSPDDAATLLERFALEIGAGGDRQQAADALDAIDVEAGGIGAASELARALWADGSERGRLDALDRIAHFGDEAAALARAAAHIAVLASSSEVRDPTELAQSAARWADADSSLAAAIEWLGAAIAAGDREAEVAARQTLALRSRGSAASEITASAATVAMLTSSELPPLHGGEQAASRLADLELALPGTDPRRRAITLDGVHGLLGNDSAGLVRALAGWNQLAAGDSEAALISFRAAVESHPNELIGWEGLRAAAQAMGERTTVAEASAALGDAVSDPARGAELWEQSALILIEELNDAERGEFALTRAVQRDIRRFTSFDKLFRRVRARKDGPRLLELIKARLEVAEDPAEIAKLFWERARGLRQAGDRAGALSALENVTMLEPDHVGALALAGEIHITTGQFADAAEKLARLSRLADAPAQQRLMSGIAAVDLYENKLGQIERALEVLDGLHNDGLSTLPVRERLAKAAAKAGAWERATAVLEQLMQERETQAGRMEAARLSIAINRDRLSSPASAARAVEKLLSETPDDGEALDLVLSGGMPPELTRRLLEAGRKAIVEALARDPLDPERVHRLARIAQRLDRPALRQAALGALVALGEGNQEIDRELSLLDQRMAHLPQMAVDDSALPELADPEDRGAVPELMRALATPLAELLGPGLDAFGVGKRERVNPRSGLAVRNELAAWAGALGVGDFEMYVGGKDAQGVYGVPGEVPSVVVGSGVGAPLSSLHRQAVARELFALRRGTTILRHRDPTDIAALVVAACRTAGVDLPSPQYAMLGEFSRLLGKELTRRTRKQLPELAAAVVRSGQDVLAWVQAANSSLDRLAAIAAGDVSNVLASSTGYRGQIGASMEAQARAARLLTFVLSPTYLALREQLGMGVR